ncbi:hypothetical protein CPL00374_CDS0043 [Klebsiella phage Keithsmous]|uniref:Uncharacterized protein n=1 Tax=Klebsiella phage Keithsmous TaxID=3098263 RepID=A0ABZ2EP26_9CAUD
MTHRVLSDNLVSLIVRTTSALQSQVFQLDRTNRRAVLEQAHNVIQSNLNGSAGSRRESVLLASRSVLTVITSTTSSQVRNLNHFEAHHVTDSAALRVNQCLIVCSVRHQSSQNRRVVIRSGVESTVSSRNVVLGQSRTSNGQLSDNRFTQLNRVSQVARGRLNQSQNCRLTETLNVLIGGVRQVNQTSQFSQYSTVSRHRQRFTQLCGVLSANVVVVHRVLNVVNQNVRSQQAINVDYLLGVFDILTFVIEVLTRFQVSSFGATNHRELCGLTRSNRAQHVTRHGHGGAGESRQDFTAEHFKEQRQFVRCGLTLTLISTNLLSALNVSHVESPYVNLKKSLVTT